MSRARAEVASGADAALLRRVARGDDAAVEDLYRTHGDALLRFVYRRVDERLEDAEEVALDTFITAVQLAPTYRDDCSVFAWLCAIAKLRMVDRLRRQGRMKRVPPDRVVSTEDPVSELMAAEADPQADSVLDRLDAKRFVDDLMKHLSSDEREAMLLRHVEELPVRDVAAVMGRSEKSVEGLLVRAKRKIRKCEAVRLKDTGGYYAAG